MSEVKDELLSHDYDGIQEYDNPLPSWWVGMFFLTIIFAVFYIPYYATGMGASPEADYEADMQEWVKLHPPVNLASEEEMAELVKDPEQIAQGKKIFDEKCMACHAPDGGGLVGPNLTDAYWLHGGKPTEIAKTIFELELSVHHAKIGTHLDQVVDVFYVTDAEQNKIRDEERLREVKRVLLDAISSQQVEVARGS